MSALDRLRGIPVLPILNRVDPCNPLKIAEALMEGGIGALEITLREQGAQSALSAIRKEFPDLLLGAGSLTEADQINWISDQGLDFGVSPGWQPDLWEKAQSAELCYFPGVLTPTELSTVLSSGCRTVKIFPIEPVGGLSYFRALTAPFQKFSAHYLPTGGIGESQVSAYLDEQQVISVGGSWITPKELIQKKDYPAMKRLAQRAKKLLHHGV